MNIKLGGIGTRTGTVSLCITGRVDATHTHAPWFFVDNTSSAFLRDVYKKTPHQFAMELENYALTGMASLARNANGQRLEYKRTIRNTIQAGLRTLSSSCS